MQAGLKSCLLLNKNKMNLQDTFVGASGLLLQAVTVDGAMGADFGLEVLSKLGVVGVVFYMYIDLKKRYERLEKQREEDKTDFLKVLDEQQNRMIDILQKKD